MECDFSLMQMMASYSGVGGGLCHSESVRAYLLWERVGLEQQNQGCCDWPAHGMVGFENLKTGRVIGFEMLSYQN